MYQRPGFYILVALCITRLGFLTASVGSPSSDFYCQQCRDQNRGCLSSRSCTPTCLPNYEDDGEGNCVPSSQSAGSFVDVSSQDQQIDQAAAQQHHHARQQQQQQDVVAVQTDGEDSGGSPLALAAVSSDSQAATNSDASVGDTSFFGGFGLFVVVAGCSVAGLVGLVVAGVCWYRLQKNVKAASEAEYPAYGVTGPNKERVPSPGDRKLAQSAQMYHYQHQKQQMLALEKANNEMKQEASDDDSEEENIEGDYTVYECPGLATAGEMEVKNPLFEETPVNPAALSNGAGDNNQQDSHTADK